jgi:hypothetical protein
MDSAFFAVVDDEGGVCQPCSYWPLCGQFVECCLYPSLEYPLKFDSSDLPETLRFYYALPGPPELVLFDGILTLDGGEYWNEDETIRLFHDTDASNVWRVEGEVTIDDEVYSIIRGGPCLVVENVGEQATARIEDQFFACYAVDLDGAESVNRISICKWEKNEANFASVQYNGLQFTQSGVEQFRWIAFHWRAGPTVFFVKTGSQSSPLGTYEAYAVGTGEFLGGTLEVTEC